MPETQGSHGRSGILDRIVDTKRREVEALLTREPELRASVAEAPPPRDFLGAFAAGGEVSLMAEVKRRSPGAGPLRPDLVPGELARTYARAGAAAVSVLTDETYFGGSLGDLEEVRGAVELPVLRKDFVLHPVQLLEARVAGADGALLITRILSDAELASLIQDAAELGLVPLVEIHDGEEAARALKAGATLVGVNNRNLQTFTTSLAVTLDLLNVLPPTVTVISESGIGSAEDVRRLGAAGVHGILVGEALLRARDPGRGARELVGHRRVARGEREGQDPS